MGTEKPIQSKDIMTLPFTDSLSEDGITNHKQAYKLIRNIAYN